jgi:hypothetical protein
MASVHAVKAKMEKKKATKQEMIDYVSQWHKSDKHAEAFGATLAKALDTLLKLSESGRPTKMTFPTLSPSEAEGMAHIFARLAVCRRDGDDDAIVRFITSMKTNTDATFATGCFIGSLGLVVNTDTTLTKITNMFANGEIDEDHCILLTTVTLTIADCARILVRFG